MPELKLVLVSVLSFLRKNVIAVNGPRSSKMESIISRSAHVVNAATSWSLRSTLLDKYISCVLALESRDP